MQRSVAFWICALLCSTLTAAEPIGGWRGNGTGIWKQGNPPLKWQRLPRGAIEGLRSQTNAPATEQAGDAAVVEKGQIREWLILGPFPVADAAKDFDQDPLNGEAKAKPSLGEKLAAREWQLAKVAPDDPNVFGEAGIPWLNLVPQLGFEHHQLAYAHTYLYSPRGGPARIVADHSWGLKAWLNGKEVFRNDKRQVALGGYAALSRFELEHWTQASSQFDVNLQPGWNRLLLKLSTPGPNGHKEMICSLRIMDPPDVKYESENIAWMAELPGRSTSTPIVVGERLFVLCEPDELLCFDKANGKRLWCRFINFYEALTPEERRGNPAYTNRVEPLVAKLKSEQDAIERIKLRARVEEALVEIDRPRYKPPRDGHFDSHSGIVGYTMPTPISDGTRVYVWNGMGVAVAFDLEGNRQWMTTVSAGELTYASSPALANGVFAVFLNRLFGIDAKTGEILWEQPKVNKNVAGLLSATLAGQPVIVTQEGEVVRPRDGHLLFRPKGIVKNDTGWTPGVILGDVFYLPKYGVKQLNVLDFGGQSGDAWNPKHVCSIETPPELNHRLGSKAWLDRSTAASPLVVGKYVYMVDMYSELCTFDLEAKKMIHHQTLDLHGFTHYNALAVAASPTLIGEHMLILDNQGTALVMTTGPEPKVVQRNVIATQLDRRIPLPAQETLAYAPPIVDGDRIYLRGERYLYCIGK
jgi:outer membrane protein assembly factor BamB